jgi:hypothetical protein
MTHLNAVSRPMLSDFGPVPDLQTEAVRRLKHEFTTWPARSVVINGALWSALFLVILLGTSGAVVAPYGYRPLTIVIFVLTGLITYSLGGAIYDDIFRKLRLLNQTVRRVNQLDLFGLGPVYAVLTLTSRMGIAWVLLLSLTLLIFPIQSALVPTLTLLVLQVGIAVAAFGLPLRTVSQRLLADNDQRFKVMLARLHR